MHQIQQREFNRAVAVLDALGCNFKIITKDGKEFGDLEVVERKKRSASKYPYGSLTQHARKHVNLNAKPGDVESMPVNEFDSESIRTVLCTMLTKEWGADTYTTSTTKTRVDYMRIAA